MIQRLTDLLRQARFAGSAAYWERRYRRGRDSGAGSRGESAAFKAAFLNRFVREHAIASVVEFGCGDGQQLMLAAYPRYLGLDVAPSAVRLCQQRFAGDASKSFMAYDPTAFSDGAGFLRADLALSLDVLLHLVEEAVFRRYLAQLFEAAGRYAVIYSSNEDIPAAPHVRHRRFTDAAATFTAFRLIAEVAAPFEAEITPYFCVYERVG